jgi:hypothetical protein
MQVARLRFWDGVGVQQPCSNLSKGSENYRKVTSGKYCYFQVFCTL